MFKEIINKKVSTFQEHEDSFDYKRNLVDVAVIDKDVRDYFEGKVKYSYKTGFNLFDKYLVAKRFAFYALVGKKGMGKTSLSQSFQLMWSIANGLIWVVAYQENSEWSVKVNYMNYLLGCDSRQVLRNNPTLYYKASDWINKHFIFIKVFEIKEALDTTKAMIADGVDVYALFLDPINSFENGWPRTGNKQDDNVFASMQVLKFTSESCTVFMSQHPTMAGQRAVEDINSYSAEGGHYLNKASCTYAINRDKGSSESRVSVDNVRDKLTGGAETPTDDPILVTWSPYGIDLANKLDEVPNAIYKLRKQHNPLNEQFKI